MAIQIKQNREKWHLKISEEEWQFENRKEMEETLKVILDIKEKKGQLKKEEREY